LEIGLLKDLRHYMEAVAEKHVHEFGASDIIRDPAIKKGA
jgi:hypothetical protein